MGNEIDLKPILKLRDSETFQKLNEEERVNLISSNPHLIAGFNKVSLSLLDLAIEKDMSVLKSISKTPLINLFTNIMILELIKKYKKTNIQCEVHLFHILKNKDFSSVVYHVFVHTFYKRIKMIKTKNPYLRDLFPKMKRPYIIKLIKAKYSFFELIWEYSDYELFSIALQSEFSYYEHIYESEVLSNNEKFELYLYALNFAKQNAKPIQLKFFPMVNSTNLDDCLNMVQEKQEIFKMMTSS